MSEFRYYRPNPFPPIVKNLIIINVLVWIAQIALSSSLHLTDVLQLNPIIPGELQAFLRENSGYSDADKFKPYQIVTHMFAHADFDLRGNIFPFHILFNMFVLWMFGRVLENVWGPKRFIIFYLACGIGAAVFHLAIQYFRSEQLLQAILANDITQIEKLKGSLASAVGASGAIMGVFAAFAYLFPNTELFLMFIPIPIKAKWAVLGMVAIDLFGGVAPMQGDNIAHFAHLGGAITGFIIVLIWNKMNRKTFY